MQDQGSYKHRSQSQVSSQGSEALTRQLISNCSTTQRRNRCTGFEHPVWMLNLRVCSTHIFRSYGCDRVNLFLESECDGSQTFGAITPIFCSDAGWACGKDCRFDRRGGLLGRFRWFFALFVEEAPHRSHLEERNRLSVGRTSGRPPDSGRNPTHPVTTPEPISEAQNIRCDFPSFKPRSLIITVNPLQTSCSR